MFQSSFCTTLRRNTSWAGLRYIEIGLPPELSYPSRRDIPPGLIRIQQEDKKTYSVVDRIEWSSSMGRWWRHHVYITSIRVLLVSMKLRNRALGLRHWRINDGTVWDDERWWCCLLEFSHDWYAAVTATILLGLSRLATRGRGERWRVQMERYLIDQDGCVVGRSRAWFVKIKIKKNAWKYRGLEKEKKSWPQGPGGEFGGWGKTSDEEEGCLGFRSGRTNAWVPSPPVDQGWPSSISTLNSIRKYKQRLNGFDFWAKSIVHIRSWSPLLTCSNCSLLTSLSECNFGRLWAGWQALHFLSRWETDYSTYSRRQPVRLPRCLPLVGSWKTDSVKLTPVHGGVTVHSRVTPQRLLADWSGLPTGANVEITLTRVLSLNSEDWYLYSSLAM